MTAAAAAVPRRTPVLVIILLSYLMVVLDISIVVTAPPGAYAGRILSWLR